LRPLEEYSRSELDIVFGDMVESLRFHREEAAMKIANRDYAGVPPT
jgi:hypothetical protein